MGEVDTHRKLRSKNNFISWERGFERAAEANDTLEHLTGEEVIPPKPKKNNYFSVDDGDEVDHSQAILLTANNNLRW
ncbi:hypothetical protein PENDEC_c047G03013 [Penicillium decumbens]|uniref:Uncharacterized protein n=1 Tax=Penicillium decumbens TaxID=69771 RepID=A0A1V6NNS1_PENDC|nr:hypothetical protein PENDEC_c047G03013 [Penicillium decumbens]